MRVGDTHGASCQAVSQPFGSRVERWPRATMITARHTFSAHRQLVLKFAI
jgi:hypothetical protein